MKRRRGRPSQSLRRRSAFREQLHAHRIFCEGKTEEKCLKVFKRHWRHRVSLHIAGQIGVPWTVVERARERRDELKRSGLSGWSIHVVFDRDEHPRFREAVLRAQECGITVAASVPCFELWGILLYRDQAAALTHQVAQKRLKALDPEYCHRRNPVLNEDRVLLYHGEAARRARALLRLAQESGDQFDDLFRNPTTRFHEVLGEIEGTAIPR